MEKIYLEFGERYGIALRLLTQALLSLAKKTDPSAFLLA